MTDEKKLFLIVDDISTNRMLMQIMCNKLGYDSDLAGSGKEALLKFNQNKYNLVLLDCQMPIVDGYEVAREMRKLEKNGKQTPIIAVTAYVHSENKEKCLAAGMNDFLAKPLKKNELQAIVQKWLAGKTKMKMEDKSTNEQPLTTDYFTLKTQNIGDPSSINETESVMNLFIETTINKIASFENYLINKDKKYTAILASGLRNNFKLIKSEKLEKIAIELSKMCSENDFEKAENIFKNLKNEFKNFAKDNDYQL